MIAARPSTEAQRKALKVASQVLVNLIGGPKLAAQLTDVDAPTLCLYGAPHEERRHMRVDIALDLDLAAGDPVMTRALAAAQGFSLVRATISPGAAPPDLADYGNLHREAYEANASLLDMLQRARLTPSVKQAVLKELADLRRAIAIVEAKIEGA